MACYNGSELGSDGDDDARKYLALSCSEKLPWASQEEVNFRGCEIRLLRRCWSRKLARAKRKEEKVILNAETAADLFRLHNGNGGLFWVMVNRVVITALKIC